MSLYGQDSNSAIATRLIRSKPVFLLTSVGQAEFTNAVESRVFRKEWTRLEARSVHGLFLQHQAAGVFRLAPRGPEIWERLWFFRVNAARDLALERSTFSMLQLHLFWRPTSFIRSTNGSANLPRPSGCRFFHAERRAPSYVVPEHAARC